VSAEPVQLSGSSQDSFCGLPEPLRPESLNYDPGEVLGDRPEGFRRSARCKFLRLIAGDCDSFHLRSVCIIIHTARLDRIRAVRSTLTLGNG